VLQKIFSRAKEQWGAHFAQEPKWGKHMLKESEEHVRELRADEAEALRQATRPDYMPFMAFARATGLRLRECLLQWSEVDWESRQITKKGKKGRTVTTPITHEIAAILRPLVGHHDVWVFTYVAKQTRGSRTKRSRYPITYQGAKTEWRRLRARARVTGFRFHDFRHDLGTKLLRKTGNLKLVQRALNHADIKTTVRYAHVGGDQVREALESAQADQNSRDASRAGRRKIG
jgi:integrase